jgi:hypothetical protein
VFDRAIQPPRFVGAGKTDPQCAGFRFHFFVAFSPILIYTFTVGIDFLMSAATQIYGASVEETAKAIRRITSYIHQANFEMTCAQQKLNLTYCELQSLRHFSGGNVSICIPEQFQTDQGRIDLAKVEAYVLKQNTTEAVTVELTDTTNGTTNQTDENQTEATEETISTTEEQTTITALSVQSSTDLSYQTLLELLNCSNAFVLPCPGVEEYPRQVLACCICLLNDVNYIITICFISLTANYGTMLNLEVCRSRNAPVVKLEPIPQVTNVLKWMRLQHMVLPIKKSLHASLCQ